MIGEPNPRQNATKTGQDPPASSTDAFSRFRDSLRDALLHIHTAEFVAPDVLLEVTGCDRVGGPAALQSCLLAAIDELEPGEDVPATSRLQRAYASLHDRFVLGFTQEETAERLSVSVRHLQRIQVDAVHLLARHLWERWLASDPATAPLRSRGTSEESARIQASDWRAQADRELASLSASEPEASADIGDIVQSVVDLEESVLARRGITVEQHLPDAELVAAVHPAVLRQALIVAVSRLSQAMGGGVISLRATVDEGFIAIGLSAPLATWLERPVSDLLGDVIVPPGASATVHRGRSTIRIELRVPARKARVVVVVEDNRDMVVFYRHCVTGLPYRIVHLEPHPGVVGQIEAAAPDIVVVDVMMPHVDGWQVITHLRALPTTREIPVIVCSVIKEEELARSLGASGFLPKPVRPRQFVSALSRVLRSGRGEGVPAPA
jgi:CheY-like chemotaxis protein